MHREVQPEVAGQPHPRRVRGGVGQGQQLDPAQQDGERDGEHARHQLPPSSCFAGAEQAEGRQSHRVPPDALWESEQTLGRQNHCHGGECQRSGVPPLVDDQHVCGGQQPGHVRDDSHQVDVMVVQQVEAAEREQHGAKERTRTADPKPSQEPEHARERRRVVGDQFKIEGRAERQKTIEQLMKRVE